MTKESRGESVQKKGEDIQKQLQERVDTVAERVQQAAKKLEKRVKERLQPADAPEYRRPGQHPGRSRRPPSGRPPSV